MLQGIYDLIQVKFMNDKGQAKGDAQLMPVIINPINKNMSAWRAGEIKGSGIKALQAGQRGPDFQRS